MKPRTFRPPSRLPWPFLLTAALLLTGCPYGSEFPLGSPAEGIDDAALLGTWKPTAESEEDFSLTISYAGGAPLTLTAESPGEETASYPAFTSAVGGELFLNIQDTAEAGQWYFANYRLHEGRLRLRLVDDELIGSQTFASAGELRAFLQRNLEDPRLYGGKEAWAVNPPLDPQQVHQVEGAGAVAQEAHVAERQQNFLGSQAVRRQVEGIAALA
jgi:hypothetical protein